MERVISNRHLRVAGRAAMRVPRDRDVSRALRGILLAALQVVLGAFVVTYPLLRLGYLGSVPEGYDFEAAFALVAGVMAAALFVLEGRKE